VATDAIIELQRLNKR